MFGRTPSRDKLIRTHKARYDNGKQPFCEKSLQRWARMLMSYTFSPIVAGLVMGILLRQGMLRGSALLILLGIAAAVVAFVGLRADYHYQMYPSNSRYAELVDQLASIQGTSVNQVLEKLADDRY